MVDETQAGVEVTPPEDKGPAKLRRSTSDDGNQVTIDILQTDGSYDPVLGDLTKMSEEIQFRLMTHGLMQKMGDAAAGKEFAEARDAMQKVVDQLNSGNWASRRASENVKINKKDLADRIASMSPAERTMAEELLASLKVTL